MSLLEELKEKLQTVCAEQDEQLAKIRVHEAFLGAAMQDIRDLSRAIAALEPSAVEGSSVAAYFDARRAEALLDPQPEAASPEFASEQSVPVQIVHEERWPYSVSYTIAESGFGSGAYEHLYEARDDYEAFKLEPKYLTVVLKHRGKVIDTFARPIGADVPEDERDETWVPPPGYTYIPTQGERCVCVNLMQDGIGNFFCCNQRGETSADAERTEDVSQAETAIEQTLITDDIPSIPREEIPVGAAVETYTDSGIETVKLGGQTYVVDDEPERQAETQPEAAYAPVNEDEARMWSNGFEADARAKAEPEQDKRPFWMFGKKELA